MRCQGCGGIYPEPDIVDGIAYFVCPACGDIREVGNYGAYLEVKTIFDAFPYDPVGEISSIDFKNVGEARYQREKLQDDRYFWSVDVWWKLNRWDLRQRYLIGLIDAAPIEDEEYLGGIGAGPLEDLAAKDIIEFISNLRNTGIGRDSEFDEKLCTALQSYRFNPDGDGISEVETTLIDHIKYHYPSFRRD